jgi:hypothetical protein
VTNRAPYLKYPISSKIVGTDGQIIIDPSSNFRDDDYHYLKIENAYYTFDLVKSQIPDSFFSFDSTRRKIIVDPMPSS